MTLESWVKQRGRGAISELSRRSGLAHTTVNHALGDGDIRKSTAIALSKATDGAASPAEVMGFDA